MACQEVDAILEKRLDTEVPTFGYGKLMERMLFFKMNNAPFFKVSDTNSAFSNFLRRSLCQLLRKG
jgi:hypothetical protein